MRFISKVYKRILHIVGNRWKLLKVISVKELLSDSYSEVILKYFLPSSSTEVYPIVNFDELSIPNAVSAYNNEQYYIILENAEILGASNVIIFKNKFIYDLVANPQSSNIQVIDNGLLLIKNRLIHLGNRYFVLYKYKGSHISEGILLSGNFSRNYYHFIFEFMAKLYLMSKCDIPSDIPVIVDKKVQTIPQLNEILSLLVEGRDVIYVESYEVIKVNKLHYLSFVNNIPPSFKNVYNAKSEDIVFNYDSVDYLRDTLIDKLGLSSSFDSPTNIFISRKNCNRRSYNEVEIEELLNRHCFETVYPETMTIQEQAKLFYNASHIVAASGAALTNIIFCKPGTRVLVFSVEGFNLTIFSSVAKYLNLNLVYILGKKQNNKNIQSDFNIDLDKVKAYINYSVGNE